MAEQEIHYLGDLQRLEIKPGDTFVLTVDSNLSGEMIDRIKESWKRVMGDAPVLVLDRNMKLGVIRAAKD